MHKAIVSAENLSFKNQRYTWSDSDDDDDVLSRALKAQSEYVKDESTKRITPGKNYDSSDFEPSDDEYEVKRFQDRWEIVLESYPSDFFDTEEAQMIRPVGIERMTFGKQRKKAYKGIPVNETNNKDMQHICETLYSNKGDTYGNFKTCMSQLARLAIATDREKREDSGTKVNSSRFSQ